MEASGNAQQLTQLAFMLANGEGGMQDHIKAHFGDADANRDGAISDVEFGHWFQRQAIALQREDGPEGSGNEEIDGGEDLERERGEHAIAVLKRFRFPRSANLFGSCRIFFFMTIFDTRMEFASASI